MSKKTLLAIAIAASLNSRTRANGVLTGANA